MMQNPESFAAQNDLTCYGDERNAVIAAMLEEKHGFAVPLANVATRTDEIDAVAAWPVEAEDPIFEMMAADLREFLQRFVTSKHLAQSETGDTGKIRLCRDSSLDNDSCALDVSHTAISVRASSVRAMWQGVIWMERYMGYRHTAVLPRGVRVLKPAFASRITTSLFAKGMEEPSDSLAYTDANFRQMAGLGYSACFLYLNLWDFCDSELLPELNGSAAMRQRQALLDVVRRAEKYGIEIVALLNAPRISADHPVFARIPALKGAVVMRASGHALCTSHELTRQYYAEQIGGLCRDVPGLGAVSFLIGGEGFLHCYTRPVPRTERITNCERCGKKAPSEVLLPLLNGITDAVKTTSPQTRVIFWPYCSTIWQDQTPEECDWSEDLAVIAGLDVRASWLVEMEINHVFEDEKIGRTWVSDYAIHFAGPSTKMQKVAPKLRERNIEMVAKTETCIDASFHSVPYIPVMRRWANRFRAMINSGGGVSWESWRLIGFWPAPSAELFYWLNMQPELTDEEAMRRVAVRIYGEAAVAHALQAWEHFSDGWERMYRHYGTYWFGPFVLGPAHPYDVGWGFMMRTHYGEGFFDIQAGLRETETTDFLSDPRNLSPRFQTKSMGYYQERLIDIGLAANCFRKGLVCLNNALAKSPEQLCTSAVADFDMAKLVLAILEEDLAFHRFIYLRDELQYLPTRSSRKDEIYSELESLLTDAIGRAQEVLTAMRRTPFLGWGYTYGMRFNERMVEEKIAKTRALIEAIRAKDF